MAKIPMGNFGQGATTAPVAHTRVSGQGLDAVSRAVGDLANTGMQLASRYQHQQDEEAEGLARAKAANAQLDYELQVDNATRTMEDDVATGAVPYGEAMGRYRDAVGKIEVPVIEGLAEPLQLAYTRGIERTQAGGAQSMERVVRTARRADFKGQFDAALDKLGKISGMPGADISAVIDRARAFAPLAQQAGLDQAVVSKRLQDFSDAAWTTQATQRAIFGREDAGQLKQLELDLSAADGYYADKLDPEKRNALLSQVMTRQQTLADRAERAADRADAKGQRVLDQIDRQIASGVPGTPEMWTSWAGVFTDASPELKAQFNERVQSEREVQEVLRMPADKQAAYLQAADAELMAKGGTVTRKQNLDRTRTAIEAAQKQMQETPLLFNASREGGEVEPLKLETLASPADAWELGAQLQERAATIDAMRKRYGQSVQMAVLLPQEVKVLGDTMKQSTSKQQAEMLGQLRTAVQDDTVFNAVMQQLAPEQPVTAYAGMLATKERASVTLQKHTFSANLTAGARDVAATMLEGNRLLQGKGDNKFPLPPERDFREAFTSATGALFAGRAGAADVAMQAVRAYYTGQSAAEGDHSGEVDPKRLQQAITASLGEVADVNGNGEVLAPWGMSADTFEDEAEAAFLQAARSAQLPDSVTDNFGAYGLRQISERNFYVTRGREFLSDKEGKPLIITITGSGP
ncbi:hypothetical protein [Stenotrophomonas sp. ATCM1_4]|uniref:hypothetical protein n=1 Tax=Stenotrophomonas sp. ATCM1_4 TaxID=2259330 RepID=UPI001053BA09|nr:hypothetical protein [Stenotrophomonas sp. ATCM1_4]